MKKKFLVQKVIDSEAIYVTTVEAYSLEEAIRHASDSEDKLVWEFDSVREFDHRVFYAEEA